jgi:hypothetical protein
LLPLKPPIPGADGFAAPPAPTVIGKVAAVAHKPVVAKGVVEGAGKQ